MHRQKQILGYGVMVTLQILVLSFLVRIQVAQQSGRFSIAFFVVCELGARGSFRPAWCAECVPRCKALPCHLRCREFREFKEFRERFVRVVLGVGSLNSISLYSPSEEGFAKQDKAPHPVKKNKRLSRWDNLLDLRKSY